ncbi:RNA polymerase sigma factor [Acrocarpospora catenulata]|uniref:RNA polymerase sigma factor n=1 Tax=Acrocarpospora catenulata TaxID=2836182 RepID=UPI001BDB263A|nr:RNA polymerase sigma factor [Acrocarpospora catenulata]
MEHSLRARVRAGDPDAFAELFDAHAPVLYRHAARMTGSPAEAEDVVSLTFLEAWRLRARVRPDGDSLQPWLFGIAVNVLRNTTRAARRHQNALVRLPPPDAVPDFADELVTRLADADRLRAARTALNHLRPAEREVVALCVWAGLSHAAAAEALGVKESTVRAHLSRARARLHRLTEKELQRRYAGGQVRVDRAPAVRSIQEQPR